MPFSSLPGLGETAADSIIKAREEEQFFSVEDLQIRAKLSKSVIEILRVNGQGGIDALRMAPNSEVLALDTSAPLVWLVQTDGAGYKTPTPYSIAPYQPQAQVDPLEQRIAALEARMEAMTSEQSDPVQTARRRRPAAEPADE